MLKPLVMDKEYRTGKCQGNFSLAHCQNYCDEQREKQAQFHSPLQSLQTSDFSKDMRLSYYSMTVK